MNIFPSPPSNIAPRILFMTPQETEAECVHKFKTRADKLMAADPSLSRKIAIAKAAEQMPNTMNKYLHARSLLTMGGVAAIPLE
jgi:hypothetical protein